MQPTGEACVVELAGEGRLAARPETLVLDGLGRHEVGCATPYTAISPGTELAAWEGHTPLRPDRTYSRVLGYCNLSRVIATGEWVRRFRPGDLVLTLQSHRSHFVCGEDEILVAIKLQWPESMSLADVVERTNDLEDRIRATEPRARYVFVEADAYDEEKAKLPKFR